MVGGSVHLWWWAALVAVAALALVAAVIDGRGRLGRRARPAPTRPPGRPGTLPRPRAGEIWWADVPYEDGPGSKDRPCLVVDGVAGGRGRTVRVMKITSKHHAELPGVISLPPGSVGDAQDRPSFLETHELRDVPVDRFRRRVGQADPAVWRRVRPGA
jgi:mRNA-degrading endonuclease toxin of MazEF toxin-antitoxin module